MQGQAFSTFKILIGAIFAITLMAIVYHMTSQFSPPFSGVSLTKDLLTQASNAPDICFSRKTVDFEKGQAIWIDAEYFSTLNLTCAVNRTGAVSCSIPNGPNCYKRCDFRQAVSIPISAKCSIGGCTIFFGTQNCA